MALACGRVGFEPVGAMGDGSVTPDATECGRGFSATTMPVDSITAVVVEIADVTGDGNADVIVGYQGPGVIAVYPGDGRGGLGTQVAATPRAGISSLAVAHFDGDSELDLVTTSQTTHDVLVHRGVGDGTFVDGDSAPTGTAGAPDDVALGHLDGDSDLDIAVANFDTDEVATFRGAGGGMFGSRFLTPALGANPNDVVIADVTGDGNADVVASVQGEGLRVFAGNGDGQLAAPTGEYGGAGTFGVVVADIDDDDQPDLLAPHFGGRVVVARGTGGGAFEVSTHALAQGNGNALVALHANEDPHLDVAITTTSPSADGSAVTVLHGRGDATFVDGVRFTLPQDDSRRPMASGDLDGNGLTDLVVASYGTTWLTVLLATCVPET